MLFYYYMNTNITIKKAIPLFQKKNGILRTGEAIQLGINPKTLYAMREEGLIEMISRGVYRLVSHDIDFANIDLIAVSKRLPKGVICLVSALSFHGLTTQIPHFVYVAYQQGWRQPELDYPPTKIFRYSIKSFESGIEYHKLNGIKVPIYSAAKTVVDCFKFRNKIGIAVAAEALKDYLNKNKNVTVTELLKFARVCRVEKIMQPYIEMIVHG